MSVVNRWKGKAWSVLIGVVLVLVTGCQPLVILPVDAENAPSLPTDPVAVTEPGTALPEPTATPSTPKPIPDEPTEASTPTIETEPVERAPTRAALGVRLEVLTEGDVPDTWILNGEGVNNFRPGDSLIIYGVLVQDAEIAIAQVQVVAQNPNSLIVQVVLVHPTQHVRSKQRADADLSILEASVLLPAASFADGYILADNRIRLTPHHDLSVGALFQAYEAQMIGQRIADYLPFNPPVLMEVTGIGVTGEVASVALTSGDWPQVGTLISNLGVETLPTPTNTPAPQPPTATPITEATPDAVATAVAEQNAQQTAVAATLTAQVPSSGGGTGGGGEGAISTPVPTARIIVAPQIQDPLWGESRQGWTTVRWRYDGQLQPGQGFDLILWYIDENRRRGVIDARTVAEKLERHGNNEYSVYVNLSAAEAAKQYCDAKYLLAVTIVDLEPYRHVGPQSDAVQIQVAPVSPDGQCS